MIWAFFLNTWLLSSEVVTRSNTEGKLQKKTHLQPNFVQLLSGYNCVTHKMFFCGDCQKYTTYMANTYTLYGKIHYHYKYTTVPF